MNVSFSFIYSSAWSITWASIGAVSIFKDSPLKSIVLLVHACLDAMEYNPYSIFFKDFFL
jgi:hypothetical protein